MRPVVFAFSVSILGIFEQESGFSCRILVNLWRIATNAKRRPTIWTQQMALIVDNCYTVTLGNETRFASVKN